VPLVKSRPLFACGVTGRAGLKRELKDHVEYLERELPDELDGRSMRSLVYLVLSSAPFSVFLATASLLLSR